MKNKSLIYYTVFIIAITVLTISMNSCEKLEEATKGKDKHLNEEVSDAVVKNGYLSFTNKQSLDAYITKVNEALNSYLKQWQLKQRLKYQFHKGFNR